MATKDFLHDLNLNLNQLLNARMQAIASDPAGQVEGQFIYNTTDDRIKYWDGSSWLAVANLSDVAGLLDYKGGYDASTNTPNLDLAPTAGTIFKGDTFTVTADGAFYTENVHIGDMLIAEVDDPAALTDWTVVEQNLDAASETVAGYIRIATAAEVAAGTDNTTAITPLSLANALAAISGVGSFSVDLDSAEASVTRVFAGGQTTFEVTHNLGTLDVIVYTRNISTGQEVSFEIVSATVNTILVKGNGNVVDNTHRVIIHG